MFNHSEAALLCAGLAGSVAFDVRSTATPLDGIYIRGGAWIPRRELVADLLNQLQGPVPVVISSPPATGKTSLIQLIQEEGKFQMDFRYCHMGSGDDPFEALRREAGLDLLQHGGGALLGDPRRLCVVVIDDAQNAYGSANFWVMLLKGSAVRLPDNLRFLISATHSLGVLMVSPVDFNSLVRVDRSRMLISDAEAKSLIKLCTSPYSSADDVVPLPDMPDLQRVIIWQCGGVIGAVRMCVLKIYEKFRLDPSGRLSESAVLQYFLSDNMVKDMGRLYGVRAEEVDVPLATREFLQGCFKRGGLEVEAPLDDPTVSALLKAGVLLKRSSGCGYVFSSPLAQRYFNKLAYPSRYSNKPKSLRELLERAIPRMSSIALANAVPPLGDLFPKESTFQHELHKALAESLPADCSLLSDLSRTGGKLVASDGELDFYVNGDLCWGVELLIQGVGVGEHLDRFNSIDGRYRTIATKDYAVVDFRSTADGHPTNVRMEEKRVTVFFRRGGDFTRCTCLFGLEQEEYTFSLSP